MYLIIVFMLIVRLVFFSNMKNKTIDEIMILIIMAYIIDKGPIWIKYDIITININRKQLINIEFKNNTFIFPIACRIEFVIAEI